jgi:hypothetical protein
MTTTKPPIWFWIISAIALIWNGMGVMAYLGRAYATDEMIAALPSEQQAEFLVEYPAWYTASFALAVFCGVFGALLLLLRKKMAYFFLIISALGAIVQHYYLFSNVEMPSIIMPVMIIVVCLFLVWLAKNAIAKNWIK